VSDNDSWSFVALQYYWLILNRRYLVVVGKDRIMGLHVGGVVVSPSRYTSGTDSTNPLDYIDDTLSDRYNHIDPLSDAALKTDAANFAIDRSAVTAVRYFPKKWGMGLVPYSGRIVVHLARRRPIELILLGEQDSQGICNKIAPVWSN
jgi:hypothetical protein